MELFHEFLLWVYKQLSLGAQASVCESNLQSPKSKKSQKQANKNKSNGKPKLQYFWEFL